MVEFTPDQLRTIHRALWFLLDNFEILKEEGLATDLKYGEIEDLIDRMGIDK